MPGSSPGMTNHCLPARSRQTQLELPNAARARMSGSKNPHDEVADARRRHVLMRAAAAGVVDADAGRVGIYRNSGRSASGLRHASHGGGAASRDAEDTCYERRVVAVRVGGIDDGMIVTGIIERVVVRGHLPR